MMIHSTTGHNDNTKMAENPQPNQKEMQITLMPNKATEVGNNNTASVQLTMAIDNSELEDQMDMEINKGKRDVGALTTSVDKDLVYNFDKSCNILVPQTIGWLKGTVVIHINRSPILLLLVRNFVLLKLLRVVIIVIIQ